MGKDFKFDPFKTYYCVECDAPIKTRVIHTDEKIWTELESSYWTPELIPLCSPDCSLTWVEKMGNNTENILVIDDTNGDREIYIKQIDKR